MKSDKILYTSTDVRRTIIDIFSKTKGRRVAITAFVGSGAEAYLPKPKGIELICWPQAGGTNPNAIRLLIKRGVIVSFADRLHMKIYWTEDHGAVITSANLSTNALGVGNLKEMGILVPSNKVDINKVMKGTNPDSDITGQLLQLDKDHQRYHINNKKRSNVSQGQTYLDWYSLTPRKEWKVSYAEPTGVISRQSKAIAKEEYQISEPKDFISCPKGIFSKEDWVLTFFVKRNRPVDIGWLYVDYLAKIARNEKGYHRDNPFQAVQVWPNDRYPPPPFKVDQNFRNGLKAAIQKIGVDKLPIKPTKRLIELIRENY
jgi:hypothetical protein